jgi:hypothetical protein
VYSGKKTTPQNIQSVVKSFPETERGGRILHTGGAPHNHTVTSFSQQEIDYTTFIAVLCYFSLLLLYGYRTIH